MFPFYILFSIEICTFLSSVSFLLKVSVVWGKNFSPTADFLQGSTKILGRVGNTSLQYFVIENLLLNLQI
jgi:hypothetical protein